MNTRLSFALTALMAVGGGLLEAAAQTLPAGPLVIRDFTLQFDPAGTFSLTGAGWPAMAGTWTAAGNEVTLQMADGPKDCAGAGRYTFAIAGPQVSFAVVADDCQPRQMILDKSNWLPRGVAAAASGAADRAHRRHGQGRRCRSRWRRRAPGRRSADPRPPASPTDRTCRTSGTRQPARTSCGARRSPASRTPAPSSGATWCS